MKIQHPSSSALASVHHVKTSSGEPLLKVRLISPDRLKPDWRTYLPYVCHDEAIQRALESAGVRSAWCQAALPLVAPDNRPGMIPTPDPDVGDD